MPRFVHRAFAHATVATVLLWAVDGAAAKRESAFVPPVVGVGLPAPTRQALFDLVVVAANRAAVVDVVTIQDVGDMLSHERRKDALACTSVACSVEIGSALGVRYLLTTRATKLGGDLLVTAGLIDTHQQRSVSGQGRCAFREEDFDIAVNAAVAEALGVIRVSLNVQQPLPPLPNPSPAPAATSSAGAGSASSPTASTPVPRVAPIELPVVWPSAKAPPVPPCDDLSACQAQCAKMELASCASLASMYAEGRGVAQDAAKAVRLYSQACDGGIPSGCFGLGAMHAGGLGIAEDPAAAAKLYERACAGGENGACSMLANAYSWGWGVDADPQRAAQFERRACEGGSLRACMNLGHRYAGGIGLPAAPQIASALYQKGCDSGFAYGCTMLGTAYASGVGVATDAAMAFRLYSSACEAHDATGCFMMNIAQTYGSGTAKDEAGAASSRAKACRLDKGLCAKEP
jgi:TPR repeat protein